MTKHKATMRELRDELVEMNKKLKSVCIEDDGVPNVKTIAQWHNGIGKIINSVRSQLEYSKLRKEKPEIDFMKCK